MAREACPFLEFLFHLTFQAENKIERNIQGPQKNVKCKILHESRFEYLTQLLYWLL
jgi:hypothetical protein